MAIPDLVARIRLDTSGLARGAAQVRAFGGSIGTEFGKAGRSVDTFGGKLNDLSGRSAAGMRAIGAAGVGIGLAVAGGFALSAKAAIDFESAFAGVEKTVGRNIGDIREGILGLAREMPATAIEIAKVAEAAGALGVAKGDIVDFTRVMVQLGEATDLTSDQAAVGLARFANIFQTPAENIERLASTLVDLGNKGASTESEILDFGQRLAAAGKQAGLTEAEVLGFSNALASVGLNAESGGTAFSRVFVKIKDAAIDGGHELETFAKVAGTTTDEFKALVENDPSEAVIRFAEGLNNLNASGQSTTQILEDLGFNNVRVADALRRAGGAADLFRESITNGNDAFAANRALITEYNARLDTTGAKLEIARNNLTDLAIRLGDKFLPAISGAAEGTTDFFQSLQHLPGPLGVVGTGLTGIVGAVAGLGGAFLLLAPRINEAAAAFGRLQTSAPRVAGALGALGKAGAVAGAIAGLAVVIDLVSKKVDELQNGTTEVGDVATALLDLAEGGKAAEGAFERLDSAASHSQGSIRRYIQELDNLRPDDVRAGQDRVRESLEGVDEALVQILDTGGKVAAEDALGAFAEKAGVPVRELLPFLEKYPDALRDMDNASRAGGAGQRDLAGALEQTAATAEEAEAALSAFKDELDRAFQETFSVQEATSNFEAAIDSLTESVMRNGTTMDLSTQKGRDNAGALRELAQSGLDVVTANRELGVTGSALLGILEAQKLRFIAAAQGAGINANEARRLADELFRVPEEVTTQVRAEGIAAAEHNIGEFIKLLNAIPESRDVNVRVNIATRNKDLLAIPKQMGGPVLRGRPYIVGEAGPELFVPQVAGNIVPNNKLPSGTTTSNTKNINQQVVINSLTEVPARRITEELDWFNRTAGV